MTDPTTCQMLNQTIVEASKSAISEVKPEMSDRVKDNLLEAINKAVDECIKQIWIEVEKVVSEKVERAERTCSLEAMSDVELLESYNRRDNIRNVGAVEDRSSDNKAIQSPFGMSFKKPRKRARMLLWRTFQMPIVCQAATKAKSALSFSNRLDV